MTIRPFFPADEDAIARLWEELVAYHRRLDSDLPRAAVGGGPIYVQRMINRADDPDSQVYVAVVKGTVVGYILGAVVDLVPDMFVPEMCGFVADVFVTESYRRRGIGRLLVEAMTAWFQSKGVRYFEWYVAAQNPDGRAFWRSLGGRDVMVRMRTELKDNDS